MLITLNGPETSAIIDSVGAQLISLKDCGGIEYIWQRAPEFWDQCSPLLFPIVGNCRDDQSIIEGTRFYIPKHGFCRSMDFSVPLREADLADFEICDTEETRRHYPYSFALTLHYRLQEKTLFINYEVRNTDTRPLFYCIGSHPGFNCPMREEAAFEDYLLEFEREETARSVVYEPEKRRFNPAIPGFELSKERRIPLSRELFKKDAVYFDNLASRRVSLVHKSGSHGVEVSFPGFETVAFWTPWPAKAPLLCIEPWNGSAVYSTEDDELIHKNHVQRLEAGENRIHRLAIRIL